MALTVGSRKGARAAFCGLERAVPVIRRAVAAWSVVEDEDRSLVGRCRCTSWGWGQRQSPLQSFHGYVSDFRTLYSFFPSEERGMSAA